jgi:hypothetical protein
MADRLSLASKPSLLLLVCEFIDVLGEASNEEDPSALLGAFDEFHVEASCRD